MTVLLTGVSSFTGYWFARELSANGERVIGTLTRPRSAYGGLQAQRLDALGDRIEWMEGVRFGDPRFCRLIESEGVDVVGAHGAQVEGYRDPKFPYLQATASNTHHVEEVCEALARRRGRLIVTGSVFEAHEGIGSDSGRTFSAYGLSKTLTWEVFRFFCVETGVPVVKFVIPNPFGPFEEERFTAYLMRRWSVGEIAEVRTPLYVRDNIPVQWLARAYARTVAGEPRELVEVVSPSGYVESQGAFSHRVAQEVRARTGWQCELVIAATQSIEEPMVRINAEPLVGDEVGSEAGAWDAFVDWYVAARRFGAPSSST